ncbi:hypothetical protein [Archaeoglobus sp.]
MAQKLDFTETLLIGSIFYSRHSIVENHSKGFQIPLTLDVVAETGEAMVKYPAKFVGSDMIKMLMST